MDGNYYGIEYRIGWIGSKTAGNSNGTGRNEAGKGTGNANLMNEYSWKK